MYGMIALRLTVYAATIYLTIGAYFFFEQSKLLFPAPKNYPNATPSDAGLKYEDLRIPVGGESHLHAWWIPHCDAGPKTILMFHGNGYVLEQMATTEAPALHALGVNLLLVDYRGYGSSTGLGPTELTIDQDADAALSYILRERKIPIDSIFVMGRSIGSGPAVHLASRNPGVAGLILESPFSSVDDAARAVWYLRIYPTGMMLRTHFDNYAGIASVRAPVFIATGTADDLTPPWMARKLFGRAGEPKKILLIDRAGHNDLTDVGGAALQAALRTFLSAQ
jgi:pimeloyl-ACP methyl ester carboxylesterase